MEAHRMTMDPLVSGVETCRLPESEYFRELAELLQESLGPSLNSSDDMWALREMLKQLKEKKPPAVQEGDVSSTAAEGGGGGDAARTSTAGGGGGLSSSQVGPMVLEALDGFFFVLNPEGLLEFVSQNVLKYLRFAQAEMLNRSIFNFISPTDHEHFSKLLPDQTFSFQMMMPPAGERKSQSFQCRFLTQPIAQTSKSGESQTDICMKAESSEPFVPFHVSAISLPYPSHAADGGSAPDYFNSFVDADAERRCIVCVARRQADKPSPIQWPTVPVWTDFKLTCDMNSTILDIEIKNPAFSSMAQLKGKNISVISDQLDFESFKNGSSTSGIFVLPQFSNGYQITIRANSRKVNLPSSHTVVELLCSVEQQLQQSSLAGGAASSHTDHGLLGTNRPQKLSKTSVSGQAPCQQAAGYSGHSTFSTVSAPPPAVGPQGAAAARQSMPSFENVSPENSRDFSDHQPPQQQHLHPNVAPPQKSDTDALQQLCSTIFEPQPPQAVGGQPRQQQVRAAPTKASLAAAASGHFSLCQEQMSTSTAWYAKRGTSTHTTDSGGTTSKATEPAVPPNQNPYFYHPDSYPDGQSYLPGGVAKPELATVTKKKASARKPRTKSANQSTTGSPTTATTPRRTPASGTNRRKRSTTAAKTADSAPPQQPSSQAAYIQPSVALYQQYAHMGMQGLNSDQQMGQPFMPPSAAFPSNHQHQLSGHGALDVAVPVQMMATGHMTPPSAPLSGGAVGPRKDHILKQLLLTSSETSPDSTTVVREDQLRAFSVSAPSAGFGATSSSSASTPHAVYASPRTSSNSMLVKLLEHPLQHTPTLPTSIATSPLDKLAQENKGRTDQPSISTRLAESLLTRQKPQHFQNGNGFAMPSRPSNILYGASSNNSVYHQPGPSGGGFDAMRSPTNHAHHLQPQSPQQHAMHTHGGFPHQLPPNQLRLPNLRNTCAATSDQRSSQNLLSPPSSAPPLNQPQSPWFQASPQAPQHPLTPTISSHYNVHQSYGGPIDTGTDNAYAGQAEGHNFAQRHNTTTQRQSMPPGAEARSTDYGAQPDSTTPVNQPTFSFTQQTPFPAYPPSSQSQMYPGPSNQMQQQPIDANSSNAATNQPSQQYLEPSVFDFGLGNSAFDMDDETTISYVQSLLS